MANLAKELEEAAADIGETIEDVVLGAHAHFTYRPDSDPAPQAQVLTWAEASPWLDEKYDSGFGGADCRPFFAYSKTWIWFVHEYDGATGIHRMPRNPTAGVRPYFDGVEDD